MISLISYHNFLMISIVYQYQDHDDNESFYFTANYRQYLGNANVLY